jgi:Holin of 3TMs, for gene-transfer release
MAGIDPISNIADAVAKIVALFKANPSIKLADDFQLQEDQLKNEVSVVLAQLEVNKAEASSTSSFVAGWRPGVGWTCLVALAYSVIIQPAAQFSLAVMHWTPAVGQIPLPTLDMALILQILLPMLGIAGLRTYEKTQGVQGNH